MSDTTSLTEQLQSFMMGDSTAADALVREILPRLRDIALRELKRERYIAPLTKTELISELWVNSLSKGGWQILNRGHFYALASLAMRRILVDIARKRLAERRGNGRTPESLDESGAMLKTSMEETLRLWKLGF